MGNIAQVVRVGAALSLWLTVSWALNVTIYADLGRTAPLVRDASQICVAALSFIAAFVATRNPGLFKARWLTAGAVVLFMSGVVVIFAGIATGQIWLSAIGAISRSVSVVWVAMLLGLAVASLESCAVAFVIAWAFVAKYALVAVLSLLPFAAETALVAFVPLSVALAAPYAREGIDSVESSAAQANLEVTSPSSFIPFTHAFFVCILVFMVASGYALSFDAVDGIPQASLLPLGALLVVAVLSHRKKKEVSADALYAAAAVLIVAGFMLASSGFSETLFSRSSLPQGLLTAGSECFSVLAWLVVARLAKRNPAASLPAFFFFFAAQHFGLEVGAALGHATNALEVVSSDFASAMAMAVALAFVAYNLVVLKPFSFDSTLERVSPAVKPIVSASAPSLDEGCAQVAKRFMLTPRETEVLLLLARGRNAQAIQEKLVVSRNTVKTHVKNVYNKLGVHSQQELIDMVEAESF